MKIRLPTVVLVVAAVAFLASPRVARAEIKADVQAGLANAYRSGAFTPVRVTLENDGAPVDAVLEVSFRDSGNSRGLVRRDVRLPNGARKRLTLYPRPGSASSRVTISLRDENGDAIWEREEQLVRLDDRVRIIGYVGSGTAGDPGIRPLGRRNTRVLVLDLEELPDQAAGYDTMDALILREPDPARLGATRVQALRQWVSGGGTLVLALATRAQDVGADSTLAAMLPVRLGTMQTVPASETGLVSVEAGRVAHVALQRVRGQTIWSPGDEPLGVAGDYGAGRVAVLGFDPASVVAPSREKMLLWERLLSVQPPPDPPDPNAYNPYAYGYQTDPRSVVLSHVGEMPPLKPPPMTLMILLLALYVFAVGPGDYLLLKKLGKLQWTWVTYPVTILVFSVAVYGYAKLSRSENVHVRGVAVVDLPAVPPDAPPRAHAVVGIYAPTGGDYGVNVQAQGAQVSAFSADQSNIGTMVWQLAKNQAWVSEAEPGRAHVSLPIPQWSLGAAEIIGIAEESPRLSVQRKGNSFEVVHGGGEPVVALAVVANGRVRMSFTGLEAGGSRMLPRPASSDLSLDQAGGYSYASQVGTDQSDEQVLRKLFVRVAFAGAPPDTSAGDGTTIPYVSGTPFLERPQRDRKAPIVLAAVSGAPFNLDVAGQGDDGIYTIYRIPVGGGSP